MTRSLRSAAAAYTRGALREDLLAALVVSVLLVPQSLAYALLAGLPPQVGIYASLLPLVAYAIFGSSPALGIGPVAVLALMISQALAQAPYGIDAPSAALVLAAEVGLLLALAAWLRLDALAALLSVPVLQGFETGAALSIAMSQLPVLVGSSASGSSLPELVESWTFAHQPWLPLAALYGGLALLALWLARRFAATGLVRVFGLQPLLAQRLARLAPLLVLAAAIGAAVVGHAGAHGVAQVGPLPPPWPPIGLPLLRANLWWAMLPSAALIALVAFVSSLVVAESLGRRERSRIVPRREMAGLAAANIAASLSGGMPVAGSFSRSVLNADAGSRSRMTGVFTAALMALVLSVLAGPLAALPKPVLAATILLAVLPVVQLGPFRAAWHYARSECVLMVVVALLTLVLGVAWALGVGVIASIALLLQSTARPHVAVIGRVGDSEHYRNAGRHVVQFQPGVMALRIDESLLFTNARLLGDVVQQHLADYRLQHPDTQRVVLQMSPVNHIDFSGLEALHALHDQLAAQGLRLDLSEVKGPVLDALVAGQWQGWFRGQVFLSQHQAMSDPQ